MFVVAGRVLVADGIDTDIQLLAGEMVGERGHDRSSALIVETHFVKLVSKAAFPISRIRHDFRKSYITRNRIESDLAIRSNHAGAELDRGDMAFAGRAQAHDESQRTFCQSSLVGMWHNRRIEQGGGLQGILARKQRADQYFPRAGERLGRVDVVLHFEKMLPQQILDVVMAGIELKMHAFQFLSDLFLAEFQRAAQNGGDAVHFGGDERTDEHAGAFRQ